MGERGGLEAWVRSGRAGCLLPILPPMDFLANLLKHMQLDAEFFWDSFLPWFLEKLVIIVVALLGVWVARFLVRRATVWMEQLPGLAEDQTAREFLGRLVYVLLLVVVGIATLSAFGVKTSSLLALLGGAALAIGLALQNTLSNLAAGLQILILRPLAIGSVVEAAGIKGTVMSVSLFTTDLKTFDGERIIVPNRALTEANIINYNQPSIRRLRALVGVSYDTDLRMARTALLELAEELPQVLDDPAPSVWMEQLADSSVNLSLRVWVHQDDYVPLLREIVMLVKEKLDSHGIEIPFPQRVVMIQGQNPEEN